MVLPLLLGDECLNTDEVCQTGIPSVLQGEHMQAVSTKSGRSWSESSSSGDGEVLACKARWAKETVLRELQENQTVAGD